MAVGRPAVCGALPAAVAGLTLFAFLGGCGPHEVLLPKSAATPSGIDLSGRWRLQEEQSNDRLASAERSAADAEGFAIPSSTRQQAPRKSDRDSLVHVFLETGSRLKITQTPYGLFVSFDRAIVEEYRFGEDRVVTVGPVEAQRVSGWEDDAYVIETLDDDGNKLVERYLLEDDGALLLRQVSIYKRGQLGLSVVQKYDRI